jgi:hypothetical protein
MKKTIYFFGVLSLLSSCGGEKGGNKRRIYFPENDQHLEEEVKIKLQRNIRIASLRAENLEVNLQKEGVLDSRKLVKARIRYLRDKILGQTFENIYNQKEKQNLLIGTADELKFYPNEISFETKLITSEAIDSSSSKTGSWSFNIKMSWRGLYQNDSLTDVLVSLGSFDRKTKQFGQYGADLIKRDNGLTYSFDNETGTKKFKLNFKDIPLSLMNSITQTNAKIFFEIKDFKINKTGMKEFYLKNKGQKTRVIISLPYGEKLFWMKRGEKLEDLLKKIDPSYELNYDHSLLSLFGHTQNEVFSYPDRNILNDTSIDEGLSFWWSNIDEEVSKVKAEGRTIVLSYFSLKELRTSQELWTPLSFKFNKSFELKGRKLKSIIGKVKKFSVKYDFEDTEKEIAYEIGRRVCMEDNSFEKKASDCSVHWNPAFSYPTGVFRTQVMNGIKERDLFENEILIKRNDHHKEVLEGWVKVNDISNEALEVKKETLSKINGGFIGWKKYDSRLNAYQVRAPFDNLATYEILNGFENEYEFNGWKREFPASD